MQVGHELFLVIMIHDSHRSCGLLFCSKCTQAMPITAEHIFGPGKDCPLQISSPYLLIFKYKSTTMSMFKWLNH